MAAIRKKNNEPIIKSLFALAFPVMLANAFQAAYQLIDAFWVGRLGEMGVAAVAMTTPVIFLLLSFGIGFAIAGSTLVAQYYGAGSKFMVNYSAAQTLLMVFTVSVFISLAGYFASPYILGFMGTSPDIYENSLSFLRISFTGLIFTFSFVMFQSFMRSIGKPSLPVYIIIVTVFLNFVLDPLLMFGWGPVPGLGVTGVALATLFSQIIASVIGMIILCSGKCDIHLKRKDFRPDLKFIKHSFTLGFPASIAQSARSLGMIVMTSLIASFGTIGVASYGSGGNIIQFVMIFTMGLSMATSSLVGQNIGAGNMGRAFRIARLSSTISFCALTLGGIIVFFTAPYLIAFFVPDDQAVIAGGTAFLRATALAFGFMGIQFSVSGVLQAAGCTVTNMILTLVSQWGIQLPLAYVLSRFFNIGITGIWLAFPVTNVIIAVVCLIIFRYGGWRRKRLIKQNKLAETVSREIISEDVVPADV